MLRLIQAEFLKLRRKKFIVLMLLSALFMPLLAVFYLLDGIGIFFAIAPVIAVVSRIKKGYWLALIFTVIYSFAGLFTSISDVLSACYPITATFNISGYYSATFGEIIISLMSLFFCGLFSVLILISKKTIKNK